MVNFRNIFKNLWKKENNIPEKEEINNPEKVENNQSEKEEIQYPLDRWICKELEDKGNPNGPLLMFTSCQEEKNLLVLMKQLDTERKLMILVESSPDLGISRIKCTDLV